MTPQQIAKDLERGREIVAQIATLQAELKKIEARLKAAGAEAPHVPLEDGDREGRQALLRSAAHVLPVRFTSDEIAATIEHGSEQHQALLAHAGDKLPLFYSVTRILKRVPKDGKAFRKLAVEQFGDVLGVQLVGLALARLKSGIPKSKTVVAWDDVKPSTEVPK